MGFFDRVKQGLSKSRGGILGSIATIFSGAGKIDDDFYEELEEVLVMGDMGYETTERILDSLKKKVKENHVKTPAEGKELLISSICEIMELPEDAYDFEDQKTVILFVGVNGAGKTTTVGKLANHFKSRGKKVMIAGADTFRAAAKDQLDIWAKRSDVDIISGDEGADPGAVVYDSIASSKARNVDILLIDTAGRLQNKKNLMNELEKINRIVSREWPEAKREVFLVLDATTGQNALSQMKEFSSVTDVTGIVLTKLDGTAKGGIAVAIAGENSIPVKYIGVGEGIDDLNRFNAEEFVRALIKSDDEETGNEAGEVESDDVGQV